MGKQTITPLSGKPSSEMKFLIRAGLRPARIFFRHPAAAKCKNYTPKKESKILFYKYLKVYFWVGVGGIGP